MGAGRNGRTANDLVDLKDLPVPIDTWGPSMRSLPGNARPARLFRAPLRHAARRGGPKFFAQGGANVRRAAGKRDASLRADPVAPSRCGSRSPGGSCAVARRSKFVARCRTSFRLPMYHFFALPDLPDLFAVTHNASAPYTAKRPETFQEVPGARSQPSRALRGIPAPRCEEDGFRDGGPGASRRRIPPRSAREVQFIAAIPLPVEPQLAGQPAARAASAPRAKRMDARSMIQTAFGPACLSVAAHTRFRHTAGGVEPPDSVLAGLLANSALTRIRAQRPSPARPGVSAVEPVLDRATLQRNLRSPARPRIPLTPRARERHRPVAGGFRILSESPPMTTKRIARQRKRLVCAIVRPARVTRRDPPFSKTTAKRSGSRCAKAWGPPRGLWADGGTRRRVCRGSFEVRCDRKQSRNPISDTAASFAAFVFNRRVADRPRHRCLRDG